MYDPQNKKKGTGIQRLLKNLTIKKERKQVDPFELINEPSAYFRFCRH